MLGQINSQLRDVGIYGGGISGLIAAYYTSKAGYNVHLYEQSAKLGGILNSTQTPNGLAESAATSVRASNVVRKFCNDLGIQLINIDPDSTSRFIVRNGKLSKMPLRPHELCAMIWRAVTQRGNPNHRTLGDWARHHLGETPTDYLLNPFTTGIYAASPDELDLDSVYPKLRSRSGQSLVSNFIKTKLRQRGQKKTKDQIKMMAPVGGMQDFVDRIAAHLTSCSNVTIHLNQPAPPLVAGKNHIVCLPTAAAATLLQTAAPATASALGFVRYAPMVSVTVFVKFAVAAHNPRGVGFLIPARERLQSLGILFSSSTFPNRSSDRSSIAVFTVMLGGTRHPKAVDWTNHEIQAAIEQALGLIDKSQWNIIETITHRWPKAIPIYDKNIAHLRQVASNDWCAQPGHVLFGNYSGDLAIRSMIESWDKLAI